jgi:hypothetical protein
VADEGGVGGMLGGGRLKYIRLPDPPLRGLRLEALCQRQRDSIGYSGLGCGVILAGAREWLKS